MKFIKMILFFLVLAALVSCSKQPKPEDTMKAYMKAWENQKYDEMYSLLSESSKESITKKEFKEAYTNKYDGINMKDLAITYDLPEEEKEYDKESKPTFKYNVSMDSLAGKIEFSHKAELVFHKGDEESKWLINWNPSMIFAGMEQGDTIRARTLTPERGEIYDQNGNGLAVNGVIQQVGLVPAWMEGDQEATKEKLAEILNITVESINKKLNQSWVKESSFVPLASIADGEDKKIEEIKALSGTKFKEESARVYPLGEAAAHLTGYMGSITAEDLEKLKDKGYTSSSRIGRAGLESVLEDKLRGTSGGKVMILDKDGNEKKVLAETKAVDGKDVNLTIRADLQKSIYNQMKGDAGSSAAINPSTGEVYALVSTPSYNPNDFILGISTDKYKQLQDNPDKPLLNKFSKTYAPGSTFKPITASIGLETGAINPNEEMSIPNKTFSKDGWGGYSVTRVGNSDKQVTLRDALVHSDNIYFARSILKIGAADFLQQSKDFGFSEEFPFPYPIGSSQILKQDSFGDNEVLLADTGYGQGQVEMSTLHVALTYTPFVTNGNLLKPTLFKEEKTGQIWHENIMSEDTASTIRKDLKEVVHARDGTAHGHQLEGIDLAGKTGTAELKQSLDDKNGQENGWFVAWDTNKSDLLVSMMIKDVKDRGGSHYLVPKVKRIFEENDK
ncbi:penicillin-binding transpeptidase domain-containing protein [Halobacillus rhizosphaerae]|uniref:penicillin-binding transpeptidase domain-containing protein n=1 Tax=Halobacillus rhizosphaerae TaxID=3064889 RepID=UPI00398BAF47